MNLINLPIEYKREIKEASTLLKNEGCKSVYLFGSLATGKFHKGSDIDIGISGLPPEKFFKVYSKLDGLIQKKIDLIDFDEQKDFYNLLIKLGEVIEVE